MSILAWLVYLFAAFTLILLFRRPPSRDAQMVLALMGCLFGVLGIFTFGIVFVPLAGLCAAIALLLGLASREWATVVLAIVAGILTTWGFAVSPSLWLLTAAMFGATVH